jgi:transposase-like protein
LEQASPPLPEQQTFQEHLRTLTRSAVRVVIEEVMREELKQFLGAAWGESTPKRKGYRNGTYSRDLATSSGPIEDLEVPRDREGYFHTQVFERYRRYEPQVAEGLTEMFVAGVSTQKVGEVAQTLMGVAPSASAVSRLNHTLTEQFETWRERPLLTHYHILYLDGIHLTVRHGEQTDATIILTALGVDLEGNKDVLALRACAEEDKDGWGCLLQDLRRRGATQMDLIVTDGHEGLLAAVCALFPATPRQRCVVHKQRNVMNAIPHRERKEVATELAGIFKQEKKEDALLNLTAFKAKYRQRYPEAVRSLMEDEEHLLTFYAFPPVMHRYIRTTNAIESFFSNVRQRTDQIDAFTTETSCLTIVWAVMQDIHLPRIPVN